MQFGKFLIILQNSENTYNFYFDRISKNKLKSKVNVKVKNDYIESKSEIKILRVMVENNWWKIVPIIYIYVPSSRSF